ncbi:hypothetical protein LUZ60_016466 [Juncus effusus]|nr:hypothetical protein LUZ60_016466 [Juncus effusus]
MILVKFLLVLLASKYAFASNKSLGLPGCQSSCIPYPFGIGANCFLEGFKVECIRTEAGEIPYLQNYLLLDVNISAERARISNHIAWQCNDTASDEIKSSSIVAMNLLSTPFRFARFLNKLIVVGCRTLAQLNMTQGGNHTYFQSGCVSFCNSANTLGDLEYKPCSGMGCCQTNIPGYMAFSNIIFDKDYIYFPKYNPCRYAALMEAETFNFTTSYVNGSSSLKGKNVSTT